MKLEDVHKINPLAALAIPAINFDVVSPQEVNSLKLHPEQQLLSEISHFGGKPLLPAQMAWPSSQDDEGERKNGIFVCQFDLSEIDSSTFSYSLPQSGLLQVFMMPYPQMGFSLRFFYHKDIDSLEERDVPEIEDGDDYNVDFARIIICSKLSVPSFVQIEESQGNFKTEDGKTLDEEQIFDVIDNYDSYFQELCSQVVGIKETVCSFYGYARFCQYLPSYVEDASSSLKLFFTLESFRKKNGLKLNIEDSGTAHAFIELSKLQNQDYSDVVIDVQSY